MDKFISLFLENLIGGEINDTLLLVNLNSSLFFGLGSSSLLSGTFMMNSANKKFSNGSCKSAGATCALGISSALTGGFVSAAGPVAYQKTMNDLQITQDYMESLDEAQLVSFIEQLEEKDNELAGGKQKTKTL